MDYLQEELEGQRRLWSALLLGNGRRAEREAEAAAAEQSREKQNAKERLAARPQGSTPTAETARPVVAREVSALSLGGRKPLAQVAQDVFGGGTMAGDEAAAQNGRETVERARRWIAGGEAGDPKALSWAFQRDARRYDGGFSLY